MKFYATLLFLLFVTGAFCLECKPETYRVSLEEGENTLSCSVKLPLDSDKDRIFNIRLEFTPPEGIESQEKTQVIPFVEKDFTKEVDWEVQAERGNYSLAGAFSVSWDDSVELNLETKNRETEKKQLIVEVKGKTDDASFCDEMYPKRLNVEWAAFWTEIENCNTKIIIEKQGERKEFFARSDGTFNIKVPMTLSEGENVISVTAIDPSENRKNAEVIITHTPKPLEDNFVSIMVIIGGLVFLVFAVIVALWLARKTVSGVVKKKEVEESKNQLETLKNKKLILQNKINKLKTKSANIGLTTTEETKKSSYGNELVRIRERLMENEEYIEELKKRAAQAFIEAKKGISPKDIKEKLIQEGYDSEEIELIKKFFREQKS